MNRRLYNNQSFLEKMIYRVASLAINNFHQKTLTDPYYPNSIRESLK